MADTLFTRTPRDELPEGFRPAWDMLNKLTGEPTFIEVFGQAPELVNLVMSEFYMKTFFGGRVEQRYKQLVRLRLSIVHGCRTCNKQNVPGALEAGVSQAQVDAMIEGRYPDALFTPAEQAVLEYADQMVLTNMNGQVGPELFHRLREHFSEPEILELGVVMAIVAGMAKLSFLLNLVEKEDYCPFVPG
ncbi:MAG: carboxymuconolactone decarboxylase family protein [Steroidobacteraceae bacterium]